MVGRKGGLGQPSPTAGKEAVSTMAWTPLLLLLLSHCTGSLSQPMLTQPASLSASPGASASLTRTFSGGINVAGYHIHWYQQKPGSPPRYLLRYKSDSYKGQGSGVPSRFSGCKDASANRGFYASLGSSLRMRLTITVPLGTAAVLTVTHTDGEVGQNLTLLWVLLCNNF
uniref:Immunoglobulin V-set domain-containing protein n=2 Tax=Macaca mulatta TaxID=9544 RepID=A0A5F7ZQC8_MACMU